MLHQQQKYGVPPRPDVTTPQRSHVGEARSTTTRHYQSPAAFKENDFTRKSRERQRSSPIRAALQDVQLNQYDSVMANSRLEEIRRKYDSQLKKFQEPHTPLRENAGMIKKRQPQMLGVNDSDSKSQSISRSKEGTATKTTESALSSASKQKESEFLAEQVKEIRKSFRADEERGRSASRSSMMFGSEIPSFGRGVQLDDPRVESIDKINLKIKQILNCLNENERNIGDGPVVPTSRYHQPAEQMNRDRDGTKELLPPKDPRASFLAAQSKAELRISESFISASGQSQQQTRQSFISKQPPVPEKKDDSRRHSMYAQKPSDARFERAQSVIPMKNSVMVGRRPEAASSIAKSNGEYILSSGKDLDQEIRKIQQKIRRSEEEKRRLDIKFESRYQQLTEKKKVLPVTVLPRDDPSTSVQKNFEAIDIPKLNGQRSAIRRNMQPTQESPSFKQLPTYKEEATTSNNSKIEPLRSVLSRDRLTSPAQGPQTNSIASVTKFSLGRQATVARETTGRESMLRRETSETAVGIANTKDSQSNTNEGRYYGYRRPVPQVPRTINVDLKPQPQSPNNIETKRLVDHLRQQVAHDEQLRNSKLNFAALQDPAKWSKLCEQLNKLGIRLSESQLKVEFQLSLEEHNPFYSVRETQQSTDSVARKYTASHDFWSKKVCGGFDRTLLERQLFRQDRVDLERKGYLTVEDFVRFLNIETGTFYRNRDLILIFRRLSNEQKVSFENFMKIVCR